MRTEVLKGLKATLAVVPLCLLLSCASDDRSWKKAQAQGSAKAYGEYLAKYPTARFADDARARIEALDFEQARSQNTVEGFKTFLSDHPEGPLADSARRRIKDLMTVVIGGRFVDRHGSPIEGVNFIVDEYHKGNCTLVLRAGNPSPAGTTDKAGKFEIAAERTYLEKMGNKFCLSTNQHGVVINKDGEGPTYQVKYRGTATYQKIKKDLRISYTLNDIAVFKLAPGDRTIDVEVVDAR